MRRFDPAAASFGALYAVSFVVCVVAVAIWVAVSGIAGPVAALGLLFVFVLVGGLRRINAHTARDTTPDEGRGPR